MGHRHILAYKELEDSGIGNIEVVAVCDVQPENAALGAREVERLFGKQPLVYTDLDDMLANPDILAVDVVTDPSMHHQVAVPASLSGKHAIVEKPLGITIRACQAIIAAAKESGAVLATAENLRRDPPNRLARSIIEHGLLGDPHVMVHNAIGGDDLLRITPWRHLKERGAIGLDMAVHYADIVQYYLGEFDEIYGKGLIIEPIRRRPDRENSPLESYQERFKTYPETVEATGEDSVIALYRMKSGAMVQFSYLDGGRGNAPGLKRAFERSVHGRLGRMDAPGDRNGNPVLLRLVGRDFSGSEILPLLPNFEMSEITERVFGKDVVTYDLPSPAIDAKHMAIEFHDFGEAILEGRAPEIDGHLGMTAVAAILGAYESAVAGRAVTMEEVLSGTVRAYQEDIDSALGLHATVEDA